MKIYHFVSNKYAIQNIKNKRVKISKLDDLNDPFELIAAANVDFEQRSIMKEWKKIQSEKWGIICCSKTWHNPVLWSHYADRHKGICLGFEVLEQNIQQVVYTKNRLNLDIRKLQEQGRLSADLMKKFFKTKYKDWEYEREVRLVAQLENRKCESGLYFKYFDEELKLTDILIGPLCTTKESNIEKYLPNGHGVNILKTRMAYKTFKVVGEHSKS